jgi:hypothetical protein
MLFLFLWQSSSFSVSPCICTLTNSLPLLRTTLSALRSATASLPPCSRPPPTDLSALQAHCRAQIKSGELSGSIWRSSPVWRKKVSTLASVFDEIFNEVVEREWEGAEAAKRGEYEDVARTVGGIGVWDKALRVEREMELGGWRIEDDGSNGAGNGGREVEAVAGWMCLVGTGGVSSMYGQGNSSERESEEEKRERWLKVKLERVRLVSLVSFVVDFAAVFDAKLIASLHAGQR